jgi:hypothetical protein
MAAKKSARQLQMEQQRAKLIESMTPLVAIPAFGDFIEEVRQMKDYTVESMIHTNTIASERESLCHKGEIRAYLWILETYRAKKEQLAAQIADAQQQAQA